VDAFTSEADAGVRVATSIKPALGVWVNVGMGVEVEVSSTAKGGNDRVAVMVGVGPITAAGGFAAGVGVEGPQAARYGTAMAKNAAYKIGDFMRPPKIKICDTVGRNH
jgi:hypothetical protein